MIFVLNDKKGMEYPNIDRCNPKKCVSGQMMKCNRIVANTFRKYLKPFGITDSQLSILFVVTKAEMVNQKKISDHLFLEKSTVNRNIARLIERGYLSLDEDLFLNTTKKGLEFLESILPHWDLAMEEINQILGRDGQEALSTVLQKLVVK